MSSAWVLSSSEDEDEKSLLPKTNKKFASPAKIKSKSSLLSSPKNKIVNVKKEDKKKEQQADRSSSVQSTLSPTSSMKRKQCKYGSKCYRKNPDHLKEYSHFDANVGAKRMKTTQNVKPSTSKSLCFYQSFIFFKKSLLDQ